MKNKIEIIMSNSDDCNINIEEDFEKAVGKLHEVDKVFTRDEVQEMLNKAQAIAQNLDVLEKQAYQEGKETQAEINGKPMNNRYMQESKEIPKTKRILVDVDTAYDEFILMYNKDKTLPNSCYYVEVVTKEVAEYNDRDMGEDIEDEENYKVGECLSYYRKLGDSGYYFRFM